MQPDTRAVLVAVLVAACVSSSDLGPGSERPATDPPERFLIGVSGELRDPSGSTTCFNPMVDPRDGTKIIMVRSWGDGRGDYEVPSGSYGASTKELLRIDCRTGEPIGLVPR